MNIFRPGKLQIIILLAFVFTQCGESKKQATSDSIKTKTDTSIHKKVVSLKTKYEKHVLNVPKVPYFQCDSASLKKIILAVYKRIENYDCRKSQDDDSITLFNKSLIDKLIKSKNNVYIFGKTFSYLGSDILSNDNKIRIVQWDSNASIGYHRDINHVIFWKGKNDSVYSQCLYPYENQNSANDDTKYWDWSSSNDHIYKLPVNGEVCYIVDTWQYGFNSHEIEFGFFAFKIIGKQLIPQPIFVHKHKNEAELWGAYTDESLENSGLDYRMLGKKGNGYYDEKEQTFYLPSVSKKNKFYRQKYKLKGNCFVNVK